MLGLELLTGLDGNEAATLALFDRAHDLAELLEALAPVAAASDQPSVRSSDGHPEVQEDEP